jgi:hypothetical protein
MSTPQVWCHVLDLLALKWTSPIPITTSIDEPGWAGDWLVYVPGEIRVYIIGPRLLFYIPQKEA